MTQYKKRFEDAVANAQYLMSYASSKCPKDINRDTIEKLINARYHVENKQELSAKEETDFWLAYQDLWKLVEPVTAESIKANLSIENTSTSKLLEKIPFLYSMVGNEDHQQVPSNSESVHSFYSYCFDPSFDLSNLLGDRESINHQVG